MPIYEYKCGQCGKFETLQGVHEADLEACPKCSSPVKKLISTRMGIIFRGPGFYCTDNRPASAKSSDRGDGASDQCDSNAESKTEAS